MSLPRTIGSYNDCFKTFDEAPCRVAFRTYEEANIFGLRMQQARALQREEHKRIYDRGHPSWGTSEFDKFIVRKPREDDAGELWWVYVEYHGSAIVTSEPLEESPNAA